MVWASAKRPGATKPSSFVTRMCMDTRDQGSRIKDQGSRIKDQGNIITEVGARRKIACFMPAMPMCVKLKNPYASALKLQQPDYQISNPV
jgi:hypothetical protein